MPLDPKKVKKFGKPFSHPSSIGHDGTDAYNTGDHKHLQALFQAPEAPTPESAEEEEEAADKDESSEEDE